MTVCEMALEFLADGEWRTTREIADAVGRQVSSVSQALHVAEKYRIVEKKVEYRGSQPRYLWRAIR